MSSKLPVEVLEHIFQFLFQRDRRNASLVCSKWHEIASSRRFSKWVFCGYEDFEKSLSLFSKTKKEFLNLEFHDCAFHDSSNLLLLSEKIWSLSFRDCVLSDGLIAQLFIKCCNLKEFVLNSKEPYSTLGFIEPLIQKRFVNKNLEILRLNLHGSLSSDKNIDSLFYMFPNIKNLPFLELSRRNRSYIYFSDDVSSYLVQRIISKKCTLETLKIFGYENHLELLESHKFPRLKRLSFLMEMKIAPSYFSFIVGLEYLEKLSLHVRKTWDGHYPGNDYFGGDLSRFIVRLIHRCLHLKHLKLLAEKDGTYVNFNPELFQALVSSNLISFKMDRPLKFSYVYHNDNYDRALENRTLRVLRIQHLVISSVLTLFLHHFKCLEFVELYGYYPKTLESISQFQKTLTSLKLNLSDHEPGTYDPFKKLPDMNLLMNYLRFLPDLESLDLCLPEGNLPFDCEYVPPNVKYLRLSLPTSARFGSDVLKNSLLPLKNKTSLEAIYFKSECEVMTDLSTWLEICSSLKELRLLWLHGHTIRPTVAMNTLDPFSETHKNLFECCPSLHCLVQKTGYQTFLSTFLSLCDQPNRKMEVVEKLIGSTEDDFTLTEAIAGSKNKFRSIHL